MECRNITILFLLFSTFCFSQEICNNAIDDDGDGLVDLNDPECVCNTQSIGPIPSIIPNASFEDYSMCPMGASQLSLCTPWIQANNTTTDYMNTCGFVFQGVTDAGLIPFPDGQGVAGALFSETWKEYVGSCLTSPVQAGKDYQITFKIASLPVDGDGKACNGGQINYGPVAITLYGAASCSAMPVNTTGAPTADSAWSVLGSAVYEPKSSWGELTITFRAGTDINVVMLGAPENLPDDYDNQGCFPYFLFDKLLLNESHYFNANIIADGSFCGGDLVLTASPTITISGSAQYQWYKDGIALPGATSATYNLPSAATAIGEYKIKIIDGNSCFVSTAHTVISSLPAPQVTVAQPGCATSTGTITVMSAAHKYSFDNGLTWVSQSTSQPLTPGTHKVKVMNTAGCESAACAVTIAPQPVTAPVTESVTYCQYSDASALTAQAQGELTWYNYTAGTVSSTAPVPSTQVTGTTTYYVTQTINGCESDMAALIVTVTPAPKAPVAEAQVMYCQFSEAAPLKAEGDNLLWYETATGGIASTEAPVPSTETAGTYYYYVSQGNGNCESTRTKITVVINPAPEAPVTEAEVMYDLNANANALTAQGDNVVWYDADGNILEKAPVPDTSVGGTTTYYVSQITNGCESPMSEVMVKVVADYASVDFPKFFTPNGDGVHDTWNIGKLKGDTTAEVYIFDRFGKHIYKIDSRSNGWDGTFNGITLPATDYWFKVVYTEYGQQKEYSSHFSLVR